MALAAASLAGLALLIFWLLSPPHLRVPSQGAILSGVDLVEPGGRRQRGVTVVVRGDRIAEIRPGSDPGASLDCEGCVVLPGLVDLHVHHPPALVVGQRELFGLLFLAHGVTSVRDVGYLDLSLRAHRDAIERGSRAGPRIFSCGRLLDGSPSALPVTRALAGPEEVEAAIDANAAEGASCVKVYNGVSPETMRAIQESAARRGVPVVAHVPHAVSFRALANVEVQHLTGLQGVGNPAGPERIAAYVAHSKEAGIVHAPTLVTFARMSRLGTRSQNERWGEQLLPRIYAGVLWNSAPGGVLARLADDGWWGGGIGQLEAMQRTVAELHAHGVPVLAGTDTLNPFVVPGDSLHEEIRMLAAAGMGSEAALAAASVAAAKRLGASRLGALETGAPADLAIFRADPTTDVAALDTLVAVVANGRLYERTALLAAAGRQREHFDASLYAAAFESTSHRLVTRHVSPTSANGE